MNHPSTSSPGTQSRELACVIVVHDEPCKRTRWNGGLLCSEHQGTLTRSIRSIPENALIVLALVGHTTAGEQAKVSGSKDQPLPAAQALALVGPEAESSADLAYGSDQAEPTVLAQAGSWALLVEEERDLTRQRYPSSLAGLRAVCQTLVRNIGWMCEQTWITDAYLELTTLARNVRTAAHEQPQPQRGKVPCPSCGMRSLFQDEPSVPVVDKDGIVVTYRKSDDEEVTVLTGGDYRCLTKLGGCGAVVAERDHDAAVVDLDTHIEQTKAVRAYGTANDAMEGAA